MPLLPEAIVFASSRASSVALLGLAAVCPTGLGGTPPAVTVAAVAVGANSVLPATARAVEKPIGLHGRHPPPAAVVSMETPDWTSGVSRCTGGLFLIGRLENQLQRNNVHGETGDENNVQR